MKPRSVFARSGFSLIEVALALIVAAGGLLTVFGLFPISLRQSQMSRSDMVEAAFASALLQTFGGNIRAIDDISVWNDPISFWKAAAKGTGLPETITDAKNGSKHIKDEHEKALSGSFTDPSPMTTYVASGATTGDENIWYVWQEDREGTVPSKTEELVRPAQYMIRLACIRRTARRTTGRNANWTLSASTLKAPDSDSRNPGENVALPNVYLLSVLSTDRGFPDVFIREPLFSQEFTFVHRP